jgi:hypothetical protein
MLDAFDRAREQSRIHEVETYHGIVAESEFRKWLESFLPARYGVTAGYVISPGIKATEKAPHYDVIIYDKLESPVLWIEDQTHGDESRAIPAEYVRSVLEVKSSFSPQTVKDAAVHLGDLSPLMAGLDDPNERYKLHLPSSFCCGMVFFNVKRSSSLCMAGLKRLTSCIQYRGFMGGIILRVEESAEPASGRISLYRSETPIAHPIDTNSGKESVLASLVMADSVMIAENLHCGSMLMWSDIVFSQFAFDLIAMMQGTYRSGFLSSFYGMGRAEDF